MANIAAQMEVDNEEISFDDLNFEHLLNFSNEEEADEHEDIFRYEKQLRDEYNQCNNEKDYAVWVVKVVKQIEANPFPIIPMFQCVRDVCGKYKPNTIAGPKADSQELYIISMNEGFSSKNSGTGTPA